MLRWFGHPAKEKAMKRRDFLTLTTVGASALAGLAACGTIATTSTTPAGSTPSDWKRTVDVGADDTLKRFYQTRGARELAGKARGVLIFPSVIAAGLGVGGEYGKGVLRVGGSPVDYYSIASVSFGLQIGAQSKAMMFLFMTEDSLQKFRASNGWSVGADASVAVLHTGANGEIDITGVTSPVLAVVMTNTGLMANLTLEGSKITRLDESGK
jgi:lipid-binding SYLF domain-containing protein